VADAEFCRALKRIADRFLDSGYATRSGILREYTTLALIWSEPTVPSDFWAMSLDNDWWRLPNAHHFEEFVRFEEEDLVGLGDRRRWVDCRDIRMGGPRMQGLSKVLPRQEFGGG
jgi:hypothetical protein